jgi:hypothetical protein
MWQTRALELNNQAYWNWEKACELVDYAVAHDFNTVIVGQVDLFDKLVSPKVTRRTITTIVSQASSALAACISTAWGCCASRKGCVFIFRRKSSTSRPICCWRTRTCLKRARGAL